MDGAFWREVMIGADARWGGPEPWRALRDAGQRFTARHYMKALDFERSPDGGYVRQAEEWRIYVPLFWRTFKVSLGVTLLCLVIGYPMAHLIANSPPRRANLLLVLVLLPFLVLPLYSVMRSIPPAYMNAAASLGANPIQALRRVYWPQTLCVVYDRLVGIDRIGLGS